MTAWLGLIILVISALILLLRGDGGTIAGMEPGNFASIMTGIALLIFIGGATFMSYRGQGSKMLKDIATWLAIALALITVYSFRTEFESLAKRVAGELVPGIFNYGYQNDKGENIVEISKRSNGHFIARVRINGAPTEMLVDTGASSIVLTPQDAARAGFDTTKLTYSIPVSTANGKTLTAFVKIRAMAIDNVGVGNVEGLVARPGTLDQSLLGMSFLSRLRSYEVRNNILILRR